MSIRGKEKSRSACPRKQQHVTWHVGGKGVKVGVGDDRAGHVNPDNSQGLSARGGTQPASPCQARRRCRGQIWHRLHRN